MSLDPLGFQNPLRVQQTLGQNFQPLQPASPLGQFLGELGESLQADAGERDQNSNSFGEIPNSWSSLSELLGENSTSSSSLSELLDENSTSAANISRFRKDEFVTVFLKPTVDLTSDESAIDDQQLEILAQQVYHLLRQRVEIDQQRWGNKCMGYPVWMTDRGSAKLNSAFHKVNSEIGTAGTVEDISEVSPLDNQLQILTQEVYILTRQRLEIEQERQGRYYPGCFPC